MDDAAPGSGLLGRTLAVVGSLLLLAAAFLPWDEAGQVALDLGLLSWGTELSQPTVAIVLVAIAALPALTALVNDRSWPRALAGLASAILLVTWLASGPDGTITAGILTAAAATITLWFATALATNTPTPAPTASPRPGQDKRAQVPNPDTRAQVPVAPWPKTASAQVAGSAAGEAGGEERSAGPDSVRGDERSEPKGGAPSPEAGPVTGAAPSTHPGAAPSTHPGAAPSTHPETTHAQANTRPIPFTPTPTFESTAPTRAGAIGEAATALTRFMTASPADPTPTEHLDVRLQAATDDELAAVVLGAMIEGLRDEALVAVDVDLQDQGLVLVGRVGMIPSGQVSVREPLPTGVADVRVESSPDGRWRVRFSVAI